jgi:hypothetical protein
MKITEHIKNANKTLFSFEILPPLKGDSIDSIYHGIDPLMEFNPSFIDVTYHREDYVEKKRSDGSFVKVATKKRPGTVAICAAVMHKYNIDTVPHIICGGFTREDTENALIDLNFLGIDNVLALRGDNAKNENIILTSFIHLSLLKIKTHIYRSLKLRINRSISFAQLLGHNLLCAFISALAPLLERLQSSCSFSNKFSRSFTSAAKHAGGRCLR